MRYFMMYFDLTACNFLLLPSILLSILLWKFHSLYTGRKIIYHNIMQKTQGSFETLYQFRRFLHRIWRRELKIVE
jgi:hypothetical protein